MQHDCKRNAALTYKLSDVCSKGRLGMTDLDDIYSARVLELSANMPRAGRLAEPDATAMAHSKLCGSKITVDLCFRGGAVCDYAQEVRACLLGQTSAAVMGAQIVGSSSDELRAVGETMRKMLRDNGPPPTGRWSDLAILEMIRDYKARHASTLLVFDAVETALAKIDAAPVER